MPEIEILLTPEYEQFVRKKVASGLYMDESEVLREALRIMIREYRLQTLEKSQEGL